MNNSENQFEYRGVALLIAISKIRSQKNSQMQGVKQIVRLWNEGCQLASFYFAVASPM